MLVIAVLLVELAKKQAINVARTINFTEESRTLQFIITYRKWLKKINIKIEKNKYDRHKSPIFLEDTDIEKILGSSKTYFGGENYKYFIDYLCNDYKVKPSHYI